METTKLKNKLSIGTGALVVVEADLIGDITIGSRTVVHPRARIVAEAGPIVIGECNIIEEQVEILNRHFEGENSPQVMCIGANNLFEVGCISEAREIGDNNVLEAKCYVGPMTKLTSGCVIGYKCNVSSEETIPENTVIYGSQHNRRLQRDRPTTQILQLDYLSKVLPNFHHLHKPMNIPTSSK